MSVRLRNIIGPSGPKRKTVVCFFIYRRQRDENPPNRSSELSMKLKRDLHGIFLELAPLRSASKTENIKLDMELFRTPCNLFITATAMRRTTCRQLGFS